jgi:hypothetical protein
MTNDSALHCLSIIGVSVTLLGCVETDNAGSEESGPSARDTSVDGNTLDIGLPSELDSVSPAWPLLRSPQIGHGFPEEVVIPQPSCDPLGVTAVSPALFRETSPVLVYGRLLAVEVPELDPNYGTTCEGDRSGLVLRVAVGNSAGSQQLDLGEVAEIHVALSSLNGWAVLPRYFAADRSSRWSLWNASPSEPQSVPIVGERVLIKAAQVASRTGEAESFLVGFEFYSVDSRGRLVRQSHHRYPCVTQIELDGQLPIPRGSDGERIAEIYEDADALWQRIANDPLTDEERQQLSATPPPREPTTTDDTFVTCLEAE